MLILDCQELFEAFNSVLITILFVFLTKFVCKLSVVSKNFRCVHLCNGFLSSQWPSAFVQESQENHRNFLKTFVVYILKTFVVYILKTFVVYILKTFDVYILKTFVVYILKTFVVYILKTFVVCICAMVSYHLNGPLLLCRSLKRTTEEIRNYSFELDAHQDGRDGLDKHRDSTSQVQRQVNRVVLSAVPYIASARYENANEKCLFSNTQEFLPNIFITSFK